MKKVSKKKIRATDKLLFYAPQFLMEIDNFFQTIIEIYSSDYTPTQRDKLLDSYIDVLTVYTGYMEFISSKDRRDFEKILEKIKIVYHSTNKILLEKEKE